MSSEALWLFKQLNLHLELEGRFQPREKGLSLIEGAAEVRGAAGGWAGLGACGGREGGSSLRRAGNKIWGVLFQNTL